MGVPEAQLRIHDLSKFSPQEFPFYARQFHGDKGDPEGFARAWLHHQNFNAHHPEFYVMRTGHTQGGSGAVNGCMAMPENYVREMVSDWLGASFSYTGSWDMTQWLAKNLPRLQLHPLTRLRVGGVLSELGYTVTLSTLSAGTEEE